MTEQPWLDPLSPWKTKAEFITWIRGGLRRHWGVHPIKLNYLKAKKKRILNPNKKTLARYPLVNGWECEVCHKDFLKVQVDHIGDSSKFSDITDVESFARHLYYVGEGDIQLACKSCHDIITHSQKHNVSFEVAAVLKKVIETMKLPVSKVLAILNEAGYNDVSNAAKRKSALIQMYTKKANQGEQHGI